ncbi:uncharacterized protein LOC126552745 isoform X1 [Aphis gossypii]|uniref:uncharacterized protein LOC126552745 isoform X1 n=2 Tax=Aphis gossypii TaxID=80765 RepID=UPI002159A2E0|nr:uncharacterized protein LOC126552745 isoform X1 [Aphis gossypii]XP_050063567.1 uncharacterized protein LOC126552745 isoform X1 [Aphis gossypii]
MDTLPSDMFYSKYSESDAPISVITEILSENDPIKFENISNQFKALRFTKVRHLAQATLEKASLIKLSGNSLTLLYRAFEMYDKHLDDLQTSAKLENQIGNFIRTQQICKELLNHKPFDVSVVNLLAESNFKCGNYEKSRSYLIIAHILDPNSFQILLNLACNYWKQSRYDYAKFFILEAIKKSTSFNICWIYYAEILVKTNDIAMAEFVYNQILRLQPDSYTVRNNYGKFLLSQNKVENAKKQFKIAQKSANNCEALSNLGDVYYTTKKYDKAILNYHKALEIKPNLKITLFNLGMVYLQITEYQKAVEAFEKTMKLDSENAAALRYLAIAYCYLDNMLKSVETYKRCLELLPDDLEANLELGLVYYHNLNNLHEAENYFKKCIQLCPEREDLYKNLLGVYQQLNKRGDASNVFISLGDLFLKKSDLENARNAFTSALFLNPINTDGHWKLGLTLHKLGHYELAIIRYKKADELAQSLGHLSCYSGVKSK